MSHSNLQITTLIRWEILSCRFTFKLSFLNFQLAVNKSQANSGSSISPQSIWRECLLTKFMLPEKRTNESLITLFCITLRLAPLMCWGRTMQMTPEVTAKVDLIWQSLGFGGKSGFDARGMCVRSYQFRSKWRGFGLRVLMTTVTSPPERS